MWRRRTSPTSANSRPSGYTIIELLVALAVASTVGLLALSSYVYVTHEWMGQGQRLGTQQSLRDAIDMVTRELRLAGSCLPSAGPTNIRALDGTDNGMTDTITVRANVVCAIGTVQSFNGPTQITLDTVENFAAGMWAYILSADTTSGEYFRVLSVSTTPPRLSVDPATPITGSYPLPPPNSTEPRPSVYGVEERNYGLDTSGPLPFLTVTQLDGAIQRAVAGIEELDIKYVMDDPPGCNADAGTCGVVDLPGSPSDWATVRLLQLTIVARSSQQVTGAGVNGFFRLSQVIRVKPRNLIF